MHRMRSTSLATRRRFTTNALAHKGFRKTWKPGFSRGENDVKILPNAQPANSESNN